MTVAPHILTISCCDRIGISAAVTAALADHACNVLESNQYGDPVSGRFFMRIAFEADDRGSVAGFQQAFGPIAERFDLTWSLHDTDVPMRVAILCSKFDHCLVDLLYRRRIGALAMDVTSIISNHAANAAHAEAAGVAFHHLPVTKATKLEQEVRLYELLKAEGVELAILARYMQVLSDGLVAKLSGRCINIHHSFLPSFKGAAPYTQAYNRGVKLIGATAHYVTSDLDEGPIIEQETERVDHSMGVAHLNAIGREIEARVLARAVRFHLEHRVLLNGEKTVVFR